MNTSQTKPKQENHQHEKAGGKHHHHHHNGVDEECDGDHGDGFEVVPLPKEVERRVNALKNIQLKVCGLYLTLGLFI